MKKVLIVVVVLVVIGVSIYFYLKNKKSKTDLSSKFDTQPSGNATSKIKDDLGNVIPVNKDNQPIVLRTSATKIVPMKIVRDTAIKIE